MYDNRSWQQKCNIKDISSSAVALLFIPEEEPDPGGSMHIYINNAYIGSVSCCGKRKSYPHPVKVYLWCGQHSNQKIPILSEDKTNLAQTNQNGKFSAPGANSSWLLHIWRWLHGNGIEYKCHIVQVFLAQYALSEDDAVKENQNSGLDDSKLFTNLSHLLHSSSETPGWSEEAVCSIFEEYIIG